MLCLSKRVWRAAMLRYGVVGIFFLEGWFGLVVKMCGRVMYEEVRVNVVVVSVWCGCCWLWGW